MRTSMLMLSGVTRQNRHQVMADLNDAIASAGGWVSDHTLFSNIAATIRFALSPGRFQAFTEQMATIGIRLDDDSRAAIDALPDTPPTPEDERPAALALTFIHDEPDLRREIPAVPG